MRKTTRLPIMLFAVAVAASACGGGKGGTTPTPITPTPTPTPTPAPTPVTSCSPLPPPITRWNVKVMYRNKDYWTLDSTPFVGPNVEYCTSVGFTDGRSICPVRPEGDPMRAECEAYAVGKAKDTGRSGPTWTHKGAFCTGAPTSGCQNSPENQYQLQAYESGLYDACAANGACGDFEVYR